MRQEDGEDVGVPADFLCVIDDDDERVGRPHGYEHDDDEEDRSREAEVRSAVGWASFLLRRSL